LRVKANTRVIGQSKGSFRVLEDDAKEKFRNFVTPVMDPHELERCVGELK